MNYWLMYDWTNYVDAFRYTWSEGSKRRNQLGYLNGSRHVLHGRFVMRPALRYVRGKARLIRDT